MTLHAVSSSSKWRFHFILFTAAIIFGYTTALFSEEKSDSKPPVPTKLSESLATEIKAAVKSLEYSDEVAQNFVEMADGWNCDKLKQKFADSRQDLQEKKIDEAQFAKVQSEIIKSLYKKIVQDIDYEYSKDYNDATDIVKNKKTHCFGFSQAFYLVGNSVGLTVKYLNVLEPSYGKFTDQFRHASCLVELADGTVEMVDPAFQFVSKPFVLSEVFAAEGVCWKMKDKANTLGIHRKIQILERSGLLASIYEVRGNGCSKTGKKEEALKWCNKAIETDPNLIEAYEVRGNIFTSMGKYDEAIADFTKALELNPNYPLGYLNRWSVYEHAGKADEAKADLARVLELDPKNAHAHHCMGYCLAMAGKDAEAIKEYTLAIQGDRKNKIVYHSRGLAYQNLGQVRKALADYDRALEIDPQDAESYYCRGVLYQNIGKNTDAIANFTQAIEIDPDKPDQFESRAITYHELGKYAEAIRDYTKAVKLNPTRASLFLNRALTYKELSKFQEAIEDFNKAIELNSNLCDAYYGRGYVYLRLNQFDKAAADLDKTIELNPKMYVAYICRGYARKQLGQHAKAFADYLKAGKLSPSSGYAYFGMTDVLFNWDRTAKSLEKQGVAIHVDSQFLLGSSALQDTEDGSEDDAWIDSEGISNFTKSIADAYQDRGGEYYNQEKYAQAIADFSKAIETAPDERLYYFSRGLAYTGAEKYAEAIADFTKAFGSKNDIQCYLARGEAYYRNEKFAEAISDCSRAIEQDPSGARGYFIRGSAYAATGKIDEAKTDLRKAVELAPALKEDVQGIAEKFKLDLKIESVKPTVEIAPK